MGKSLKRMVGVAGFEPATPTSRTYSANAHSMTYGAPCVKSFPSGSRSAHPVSSSAVHLDHGALRICAFIAGSAS
jgi:hypothetical protein